MRKLQCKTIFLWILLAFTHVSMAADLGQTLSMQGNASGATACIACHGANGNGLAASGFPRLAGLDPEYIEKQLQDFAAEKRVNAVMAPIAKALSDEEIKAVASYYAQMTMPPHTDKTANDEFVLKQGMQLAVDGAWSKNIPACFACHGEAGGGIGKNFPALAGQHALYIEQQINAWRNGQRKNDPNDLMKGVASRLSDAEIKAVSAYLASLSTTWN